MDHDSSRLWQCPKCGNYFVTANMSHSCANPTLEALFARSGPSVLEVYRAFEALALSILPIRVVVQKTRVCFQLDTRFSGGMPRKDHFVASFIFFQVEPNPRFHKVEHYGPIWIGHSVRLYGVEDVDDEVRGWLLEAARYGRREHLDSK
jgi:hypothetical protein